MKRVALFTRAWIEISSNLFQAVGAVVALFTRAWIEISKTPLYCGSFWSPSSRGRGLKSFPIWYISGCIIVALFTRAWIEISWGRISVKGIRGRPLHEGVDWNAHCCIFIMICKSRPLHEGVDWNVSKYLKAKSLYRRPLHEGVDWNVNVIVSLHRNYVSPSSRGRGLKYVGTL